MEKTFTFTTPLIIAFILGMIIGGSAVYLVKVNQQPTAQFEFKK